MTQKKEFEILIRHAEKMLELSKKREYEHGVGEWKLIIKGLREKNTDTRSYICWILDMSSEYDDLSKDIMSVLEAWREEK